MYRALYKMHEAALYGRGPSRAGLLHAGLPARADRETALS